MRNDHDDDHSTPTHLRIIELSDAISDNLKRKMRFVRAGAEPPAELAEEHARLTALLARLQDERGRGVIANEPQFSAHANS